MRTVLIILKIITILTTRNQINFYLYKSSAVEYQDFQEFTVNYKLRMSFGELSRMSQIRDRNIYAQTDQLYEPLRNALRKSTVSQSLLFPQLNISKVGRNMRSLSPVEAQIIKRNLYIPVNKQLVPTRNLQKVLGKNFTAVDMNETIRQALTPQEFNRVRRGTTEEIIYEIKDEPARNDNIYTCRENIPNSRYNHPHVLRESKIGFQNSRESRVNFNMQRSLNRQSRNLITNQPQINRQIPVNIVAQPLRQSQVNINSQASHPSNTNIYTQPQDYSLYLPQNNLNSNHNQRQSLIAMDRSNNRISSPFIGQNSSKQNANRTMTSVTALRNDVNANEDTIYSVKSRNENNSNFYDFRASKVSDKSNKISRKSKDEYKYNLFSALDEAGNTNCRSGCFHSNEIVASKIQHNPWK